jgi:hypothetical protein
MVKMSTSAPAPRGRRRLVTRVALVLGIATVAAAGVTGPAGAFAPASFSTSFSTLQAGAHPDFTTDIELPTKAGASGGVAADGNLKDLTMELPVGFMGNPLTMARCTTQELLPGSPSTLPQCPVDSQVGFATLDLAGSPTDLPVYNMVPSSPNETARFAMGLTAGGIIVNLRVAVRTDSDYGLTVTTTGISHAIDVLGIKFTLWGVPASSVHDPQRFPFVNLAGYGAGIDPSNSVPSGRAPLPLLTNPTSCGAPLQSTLTVNSYQDDTPTTTASVTPSGVTGCAGEGFAPSLAVHPDSSAAGQPSGYTFDMDVPQNDDPDGLATSHLKSTTVRFPAGVAISPSAANGLEACSDAQLRLGTRDDVDCPAAAKVGTARFDVPALVAPLVGSIYIGQPEPDDLYRVWLVAEGSGVLVKIPGSIDADPVTGRLTAHFDNTPQVAFNHLTLKFFGGPEAVLANPTTCGSYDVTSTMTPWSGGPDVTTASTLRIDQGCGAPGFSPSFSAGTVNPVAGATSTFTLQAHKPDGQPDLNGITLSMPAGLLAQLKGNLGQRIGTARVAAGSGSNPVWLSGPVVLEGPYGDAPFSLRVTIPAIAGPFNLGDVVVRQKIYVDPVDARVTVVSDPFPTILAGVPVRLQNLAVDIDKPGFMLNPTDCTATAVGGTLGAATGQTAAVSSRFQVGDCARLDLQPKLALALTGKGQTTDDKHPALTATLTQSPGQSNLKHVKVALPLSMALDPDNSQSDDLCEFLVGQKTVPDCPAGSIVGSATATTPILDQPLTGPVYFVKNVRTDAKTGRQIKTLPTLVIPLRGQGVTLVLRASSEVVDDRLVTTFDNIPDAPVSGFKLTINGGKKGILVVSGADLCKATQVADQTVGGQSGKVDAAKVVMSTPCMLGVEAASHTSTSLRVMVGGIGAGKVTISGKGLRQTSRHITRATTATVSVPLSQADRRALARHRNVKATITVRFDPAAAGAKTTKVVKALTIHAGKHR